MNWGMKVLTKSRRVRSSGRGMTHGYPGPVPRMEAPQEFTSGRRRADLTEGYSRVRFPQLKRKILGCVSTGVMEVKPSRLQNLKL